MPLARGLLINIDSSVDSPLMMQIGGHKFGVIPVVKRCVYCTWVVRVNPLRFTYKFRSKASYVSKNIPWTGSMMVRKKKNIFAIKSRDIITSRVHKDLYEIIKISCFTPKPLWIPQEIDKYILRFKTTARPSLKPYLIKSDSKLLRFRYSNQSKLSRFAILPVFLYVSTETSGI